MTIEIIEERLSEYNFESKQDELNALKEICQEIALAGLARSDFFKIAGFQGGTCLRILHNLRRFSEDLDFIMIVPVRQFNWLSYLNAINEEYATFGLHLSVQDKSTADATVKKAFLKEDSFGKVLNLKYQRSRSDKQTIVIKLEIDTNPPIGSSFSNHFLNYPYPFSITTQDLPSLFAGKCHALLCRSYAKGRDWFDLLWYLQKKISVNHTFFKHALEQTGPYIGQTIFPDNSWLIEELSKKINVIDWNIAKQDVVNFIPKENRNHIEAWSSDFFLSMLQKSHLSLQY